MNIANRKKALAGNLLVLQLSEPKRVKLVLFDLRQFGWLGLPRLGLQRVCERASVHTNKIKLSADGPHMIIERVEICWAPRRPRLHKQTAMFDGEGRGSSEAPADISGRS